jgi:hypothetical protein
MEKRKAVMWKEPPVPSAMPGRATPGRATPGRTMPSRAVPSGAMKDRAVHGATMPATWSAPREGRSREYCGADGNRRRETSELPLTQFPDAHWRTPKTRSPHAMRYRQARLFRAQRIKFFADAANVMNKNSYAPSGTGAKRNARMSRCFVVDGRAQDCRVQLAARRMALQVP